MDSIGKRLLSLGKNPLLANKLKKANKEIKIAETELAESEIRLLRDLRASFGVEVDRNAILEDALPITRWWGAADCPFADFKQSAVLGFHKIIKTGKVTREDIPDKNLQDKLIWKMVARFISSIRS